MYYGMLVLLARLLQEAQHVKVFSAPNYVDQAGNKGAFVGHILFCLEILWLMLSEDSY